MPLVGLDFTQTPLLAKLDRIEHLLATEQQWCKGRLRDSDGRHCLVGAIEAADAWSEIARVVLRAAREVGGKRYWRIESFNDDPRTTHADVLAVLRLARQNIIADMASEGDARPWRRKCAWALRTSPWGSAFEANADLPRKCGKRLAAFDVPFCGSRSALRLMIPEDSEVL
jgi:hypothetical protein